MDANGQTFRFAHGGNAWRSRDGSPLDTDDRRAALASLARAGSFGEAITRAPKLLDVVPMARDSMGGRAWWDPGSGAILSMNRAYETPGVERGPAMELFGLPDAPTDIALGHDGCIYVALPAGVLVRDSRDIGAVDAERRPLLNLTGFQPWRLAPDPNGGVWVLAKDGKLARITGTLPPTPLTEPPPLPANAPPAAITFEPDPERERAMKMASMKIETPTGVVKNVVGTATPAAVAPRPGGGLSLLVWDDGVSVLHVVFEDATVVSGVLGDAAQDRDLTGATAAENAKDLRERMIRRPYSVVWLDDRRFAVLAADVAEAVVFAFDDEALRPLRPGEEQTGFNRPEPGGDKTHTLRPSGDFFPLDVVNAGPFLHGVTDDIEYAAGVADGVPATRPLVAVSLANFAEHAIGELREPLDGGAAGTAWHRLYVDALIPPETGFTILAAATDDSGEMPGDAEFFPHDFGDMAHPRAPLAAWVKAASELPGHAGFTPHAIERDRAGLFTVLLQRGGEKGRRTRALRGRFLHLRIELRGNGRATPCLHALRAWAPRFSYADKYLPEIYREQIFGADADKPAPSTREDFLCRLLANFEGMLTPLEDSVAAAWRLTDPRIAPDDALPWLAQWIGVSFSPWFPASRRRAWLRCAPEQAKMRGTPGGLRLALEVATNGGVSAGRVVVLEDFRMRRTLGTLLGVSLDKDYDDLLGGPVVSGNSKLGRTLILTDRIKRELFALFDARLLRRGRDRRVVDEFFARLAYRVTVLIHEAHGTEEQELIRRIAEREAPAHVVVRVVPASGPLIVGLTSLLGVDTFFRPPLPKETVTVGQSIVGGGALLRRPPSLYPRYA